MYDDLLAYEMHYIFSGPKRLSTPEEDAELAEGFEEEYHAENEDKN